MSILFSCTKDHVYKYFMKNIPYYKAGVRVYFDKSDVCNYLDSIKKVTKVTSISNLKT